MTVIDDTELRLVVLEGASLVPRVHELVQPCTTDPDPGHCWPAGRDSAAAISSPRGSGTGPMHQVTS